MTLWQIVVSVLGILLTGIIVPIGIQMWKMRTNDFRHLEEAIQRVEDKLDKHLEWHLGQH